MSSAFPTPAVPPPAPKACPFCASAQVATASKAVNDNTYWRCRGCGQIWNPSRLVTQRWRSR